MPEPQDAWTNSVYIALGRLINEARSKRGVTQESLATQVGLTRSSITNLEAGRQRIQIHLLLQIASALDVPPAQLLPEVRRSEPDDLLEGLGERLEDEPDSAYQFVARALQELPGEERG